MGKRIDLLIIDPQNDFCNEIVKLMEKILHKAALYVRGAEDDMTRLAAMIDRIGDKLYDIHVTLDSHRLVSIWHPIFWVDKNGNNPIPYTIITAEDVRNGVWKTRKPGHQVRALDYVTKLEQNGRYPLCIWPPHCLIATWGYSLFPAIEKALFRWEERNFANVDYVTKGSNPFTEHYSGVQADVPDPTDSTTQLNTRLIETLEEADIILLAGEAKSHCLANTVTDIANKFDKDGNGEYIKKLVLLEDATSNVGDAPGSTMFKDMGDAFVADMCSKGMTISNTVDFLA